MNCSDRLDSLLADKYSIWQADDVFCYTMDSVLIANFATLKKCARVLELGSGTGAISLLLAIRGAQKVIGVDINPRLVCLFNRSITENNLQHKMQACNIDIKNKKELIPLGRFELVIANPPYRTANSGNVRSVANAGAACHELSANLEDFIIAGSKMLQWRGRLAMVNVADRLSDTLELLAKHNLKPKRLQMVHSKSDVTAHIFLVEAVLGGANGGLEVLPPLIVYNQAGEYTQELLSYYRVISNTDNAHTKEQT